MVEGFVPPVPPANVQYWFNYCNQFDSAPGGNLLHLFDDNDQLIPLNPPMVGTPPVSVPAEFNGPFLINDQKGDNLTDNELHPNPKGAGVFLGFYITQGRGLPSGNGAGDPREWSVVHGRVTTPKRFLVNPYRKRKGKSKSPPAFRQQLLCYARARGFTNQATKLPRTKRVKLADVHLIKALQPLDQAQIIQYVDQSRNREIKNQPGETKSNLEHLRDLQLAHIASQPTPTRQARLRAEYGL